MKVAPKVLAKSIARWNEIRHRRNPGSSRRKMEGLDLLQDKKVARYFKMPKGPALDTRQK